MASSKNGFSESEVISHNFMLTMVYCSPPPVDSCGIGPAGLHQNGIWDCGTSATCVICLLYTSPSPRDRQKSRMPSSA